MSHRSSRHFNLQRKIGQNQQRWARRRLSSFFEPLEKRALLAGLPGDEWPVLDSAEGEYSLPPIPCDPKLVHTTYLPSFLNADDFKRCGGTGEASDGGEGIANSQFVFNEIEPNNDIINANSIPLGLGNGQRFDVDVVGRLGTGDNDYFRVSLKGGDVIGVAANGAGDISIQDSQGIEIYGTSQPNGPGLIPTASPLPRGAAVEAQAVIPRDGDYYVAIGDGASAYRAWLRVFRPPLATQNAVNQHQIIFLDFNGIVIDRTIFSQTLTGVARLSPMRNSLTNWGLSLSNENEVIDAIIAGFTKPFDGVRVAGENGDYFSTGIPGQYDFEVRNSRDHADPWGQPNVSRVHFGGTAAELQIGTIGIAEGIDPGNFDTTMSAVVLLDILSDPANGVQSVLRAPGVNYIDLIGDLVGGIGAHEAGHFFGNWHTDPFNQSPQIMDSGAGGYTNILGLGPDLRAGTADDIPVGFGTDEYFRAEQRSGVEETGNVISWGLSSGTIPTSIRGNVWQDLNGNALRESNEPGVPNWTVFADVDRNGLLQGREPTAITDNNGNYILYTPPGTYVISEVLRNPWEQTFPKTPVNLAGVSTHTVSVSLGSRVDNINFGNKTRPNVISGYKYQDLNSNGVDDGEPRMSGFVIYVDRDGDGRLDTGEPADATDNFGVFQISTNEIGNFVIRESQSPGWLQTQPANRQGYSVSLEGGTILTDLAFGNAGPLVDFGDAPDPYPTKLKDDGARAAVLDEFHLGLSKSLTLNPGAGVDLEADGQPSIGAVDDDITGVDDEDGVTFGPVIIGQSGRANVIVTVGTGISRGALQGWIDFNQDGDWDDSGEQIFKNLPLSNGVHTNLTFAVPANARPGQTYARFRYGYETDLGPRGFSGAGEVEDYTVQVLSDQPIAVNDTFDVNQNSSNNVLDVLANDFPSSAGGLIIASISNTTNAQIVGNKIVYKPTIDFVGTQTFTYTIRDAAQKSSTATVTVNVLSTLTGPVAIDDSYSVASASINTVDVLANDLAGPNGPISLFSVNDPSGLLTLSITEGKIRIIVPATLEGQSLQFSYTVVDSGFPAQFNTATVTLHVGNSAINDIISLSVQPLDLNGNPILSVNPGQDFQLGVFAQDLRSDDGDNDPSTDLRGAFAAYADLLYSTTLVSATGAPIFRAPFNQGTSGSVAFQGLVNELGAFRNSNDAFGNGGDAVLYAILPMRAKAIGEARFTLDPADELPLHNTLLYEPPSPVAFDRITFGTASLFIGKPEDVLYRAVDDTFEVPANVSSQLAVMNNDLLATQLGKIVDISSTFQLLTNPFNGTVSRSADRKSVIYTPAQGFVGADQFRYTLVDQTGVTTSATVSVFVGGDAGHTDDLVEIRYVATDLNGNVVTNVNVGDSFLLRAFVKDLRPTDPLPNTQADDRGVFAVYADALYNFKLATPVSVPVSANPKGFDITFPGEYTAFSAGNASIPGLIDEPGALQGGTSAGGVVSPLGPDSFLVWQVKMKATAAGNARFVADPADVRGTGSHEILLHEPPGVVALDKVHLISTSLQINGGSGESDTDRHNSRNAYDVNNDGFVSPIDALLIIRELNQSGSINLAPRGPGDYYFDVVRDGRCTPADALAVINYLNFQAAQGVNGSGAGGEGEGESQSSPEIAELGLMPDSLNQEKTVVTSQIANPGNTATNRIRAIDELVFGANVIKNQVAAQRGSGPSHSWNSNADDDLVSDLAADIVRHLGRK